MKIVVAYKWAGDYQEARVGADGSVDWSRARDVVSDYDAVAIEAARRLADAGEAQVVGLTVGGPGAASPLALKTALARGLDRVVAVTDPSLERAGTARYAQVLAAAVRHIGDVGLVLAGDSSIDVAAKMVHVLLAGRLGWPAVTEASDLQLRGEAVRVHRQAGGRTQTLELGLPAVVALASDALRPRVPGMKDVLRAGKKPKDLLSLDALGLAAGEEPYRVVGRSRPQRKARLGRVIDASEPARAAGALVQALRDEGAL